MAAAYDGGLRQRRSQSEAWQAFLLAACAPGWPLFSVLR